MEFFLNTIGNWLEIFPWLLPTSTMLCFLVIGFALYIGGQMSLKSALFLVGTLGIFMIGHIYATEYLIKIGFLT